MLGELTQLRAHDRIPAAPPQDAVVFRGANAAEAASKAFPWISTSFIKNTLTEKTAPPQHNPPT